MCWVQETGTICWLAPDQADAQKQPKLPVLVLSYMRFSLMKNTFASEGSLPSMSLDSTIPMPRLMNKAVAYSTM